MNKSLLALALGTFEFGITEYVMMSILEPAAAALGVSVPTAGILISAYALGVCTGAPLVVLVARRQPLKRIMLALACLCTAGGLTASLAPSFYVLLAARFVSGLPHGAWFGVGSIIAQRTARAGREASAVSAMVAGMTVANMAGVPLCTLAASFVSWRAPFIATVVLGVLMILAVHFWIPYQEPLPDRGFRGQFRFLRDAKPWLLLLGITMSNGGLFCWYSYINPLITRTAGFSPHAMTLIAAWAGLGMVMGNLLGGRLSDRFAPTKVTLTLQSSILFLLTGIFFFFANRWAALGLTFLGTGVLFALSAPQQLLAIRFSPGGEMLGAACAQVGFNLGNALGAWAGALPVRELGLSYPYTALMGTPFALAGFLVMLALHRRATRTAA